MRLWHQSRTELAKLPKYAAAMTEHFRRVGQPSTVVDLHGLTPSTYVTEYPGHDNRYVYLAYLHSLQLLRNVQQAEAEGYDGFLIMNLPENIHAEAQSLVDIPVISYAQASMYAAAMLGQRFAVLTMIDDYIPLYESHIEKYGMRSRAWGVQSLGQDYRTVFDAFDSPGPVVDRVSEVTRRLAREHGVDVVIPGEAPVSTVLSVAGLTRVDEIAVVDCLGVTLKFGEMLVDLARTTGMRASASDFFSARPPAPRLAEVERFYGLDRFGTETS
ncbi:MAG TPA: aspartate/glutamate racemase family protein [Pseudonocardiaceae bacterium]|nr:aspartate/glutamate racemase family protein [Pseudonocardiaceae bacterium]